jgi:hypothetical protein
VAVGCVRQRLHPADSSRWRLTPIVRLRDIFRLTLGAIVAETAVALALQMFDPSHFVTIGVSGLAGGVWWLAGYQKLSRTRGWESLQVRFSPVNGRIILASALVGLILICLSWGVAEILEMAGIGIKALPPQAILPNNLRELPLAIAVVVVSASSTRQSIGLPFKNVSCWEWVLHFSLYEPGLSGLHL